MNEIEYIFVISDEFFHFNSDIGSLNLAMQKFIDVMNKIFKEPQASIFLKKLGEDELFENYNFYGLMYDLKSPVDRDYRLPLSVMMSRKTICEWDVEIAATENVSAVIERCLRCGKTIAALGLLRQEIEGRNLLVICDKDILFSFYRIAPEYENSDAERFIEHAKRGCPNLHFVSGIHRQIRKFEEDYFSIRAKIMTGLAYLNDKFLEDANEERFVPDKIQARFHSSCRELYGVSPESSKTLQDTVKRKARIVAVNGQEVICEWHIKISPTHDRIHFAFDKTDRQIVEGKIIIGIFSRHLPT